MNVYPNVIHIEGMDLAGKSTVTRGLARRHPGCVVRHNALTDGNEVFELAYRLRRARTCDSETLGLLYAAAAREDLRHTKAPVGVAVQDSTIVLRSLAFYTARGMPKIRALFEELLPLHPRFGASIVLTASIEARKLRLAKRMAEEPDQVADDDLMVLRAPERFLAMEQALIEVAVSHFRATVIDTSDLGVSGVLAAVDAALTRQGFLAGEVRDVH